MERHHAYAISIRFPARGEPPEKLHTLAQKRYRPPMKHFLAALLIIALLPCAAPAHAASPSLSDMIGQMLMVGFRGDEFSPKNPVLADIISLNLGGVVLFDYDVEQHTSGRNIKSPAQVNRLIQDLEKAAKTPLLISVDQEGGRVQRLKTKYGFIETPSAEKLGVKGKKACREAGETTGKSLARAGFNLDFAPVTDVNVNPDCPVIGALGRSFSHDPKKVADCAHAFITGLHEKRILSCIKHFPGHGSAGADSHLGLVDVTDSWSETELTPYRKLISRNAPDIIMTAHIFNANLDPDYPATLSKATITGLLRKKLGWDGVVITDDMNMRAITDRFGLKQAVALAIQAGADMLLFGNNISYDPLIGRKAHAIIMELVQNGIIDESRIRKSFDRIRELKKKIEKKAG